MPRDPESQSILDWLKAKPSNTGRQSSADSSAAGAAHQIFGSAHIREPLSELERLLLPTSRAFTKDDVQRAKNCAASWDEYGFEVHEVRTWLRSGLEPGDADMAASLIEEGITPSRLMEQFTHPSTGERTTILDVARGLPQVRAYDASKTLCNVLDDAGIERVRGAAVLPRWLRHRRQSGTS